MFTNQRPETTFLQKFKEKFTLTPNGHTIDRQYANILNTIGKDIEYRSKIWDIIYSLDNIYF